MRRASGPPSIHRRAGSFGPAFLLYVVSSRSQLGMPGSSRRRTPSGMLRVDNPASANRQSDHPRVSDLVNSADDEDVGTCTRQGRICLLHLDGEGSLWWAWRPDSRGFASGTSRLSPCATRQGRQPRYHRLGGDDSRINTRMSCHARLSGAIDRTDRRGRHAWVLTTPIVVNS